MIDFVTANDVPESPEGAANEGYFNTPVSTGKAFGAMFGESSVTQSIMRHNERQQAAIDEDPTAMIGGERSNVPMLSPEEANKKYAPVGPDGKQVSITDQPMYESVAKQVGKSKADELDRQGVLARYAGTHGLVQQFGVGTAAFLSDPLNMASVFVPGVGEENALAGMSRVGLSGIYARTGARLAEGASGAAFGQAPLSLTKYGLGREEASDYDLRTAFKDMAFAAAGGAIIHAGLGAAIDKWKSFGGEEPPAMPEPPEKHPQADAILNADAQTKDEAMRSAVSQVVSGREVDVDPWFPPEYRENFDIEEYAKQQQQIYKDGYAPGMTPDEMERATNEIFADKEKEEAKAAAQPVAPAALKLTEEEAAPKAKYPIMNFLRQNGGVRVGSVLDSELRNMGITPRSAPGLFRKEGGLGDVDNFPTREWKFGHAPDDGNGYVDRQHVLDRLAEERSGRSLGEDTAEAIAREYGIEFEGKTPKQFWEEFAERQSREEQERVAKDIEASHNADFELAEKQRKEWLESRGEAWEPEKENVRTLEELENERQQEITARETQYREAARERSEPSAGTAKPVQERSGSGGITSQPSGRAGQEGAERGGDTGGAEGERALTPQETEIAALEAQLNTAAMTAEERAEIDAANRGLQEADAYRRGYQAAAECLAQEGE